MRHVSHTQAVRSPEAFILAARAALLWEQPFFGALACQLDVIDATGDPRFMTMATDGKHLWFHGPFVMSLTKAELMFVLAHEVMHNALEHHIRRKQRHPKRWNKATDYAINGELVATGCGRMPKCGLIDEKYTGLSAEEIYRLLTEEDESKPKPKKGKGDPQQGQGQPGEGDEEDEGEGSDPGGCGETVDACSATDTAKIAELRAENQARVRQAANMAKAAGSMPDSVKRIIENLTKPVVDWRAVLRRFIDSSVVTDTAWSKPIRRFLPRGLILPGQVRDGVSHFVIAVDTSGSINVKTLTAFASEIDAAMNEGMIDKVTIIYADAAVAKVDVFESGEPLVIDPAGGGGTAFSDTFKWVADNASDATLFCYFTDLYVSDFGKEPAMPVLWAVYGDEREYDGLAAKVPFGEAVSLATPD